MLRLRSMLAVAAAFAGLAGTAVEAANTAQWKSRTIYQVLTDRFFNPVNQGGCSNLGDYCGGTWRGIIDHLDYIQSMGFDAIWISPMPANAPGGKLIAFSPCCEAVLSSKRQISSLTVLPN
jgi:alpha-amylase